MNPLAAVVRQVRYEQKSFWRNPQTAFFTFIFPLLFLVIFASLNRSSRISQLGGISYNQYYVPSIIAFGVMSACYTNLAITIAMRRDAGILKRFRGTPLPAWAIIGGYLGNALIIAVILTAITMSAGMTFYDVTFPGNALALATALVAGSVCFSALGVAVNCLIRNADAAPPVVNGVFFPLLFISGTFFPVDKGSVLAKIAEWFPVRHFIHAVFLNFDPSTVGLGFDRKDLVVMGIWTLAALIVAVRRFQWEPRR